VNDSSQALVKKARILCVEDDRDTCELISVLFPQFEVKFAYNMSEGIRLFENETFDLCILDNWLPDGSGIDLCRKIRAINPNIPIVFASAVGYKPEIQKALDAGAQEYLVKPYEPEKLQKIVKNLVEKQQLIY
jgi:two-component system, OmpR family, copper resistance phosphate regulon response regulator CusR